MSTKEDNKSDSDDFGAGNNDGLKLKRSFSLVERNTIERAIKQA